MFPVPCLPSIGERTGTFPFMIESTGHIRLLPFSSRATKSSNRYSYNNRWSLELKLANPKHAR
jgi:hypothetical protein